MRHAPSKSRAFHGSFILPAAMALSFAAGCEFGPETFDVGLGQGEHALASEQPNNLPVSNGNGFAASYSKQGSIDVDGAFFTPQGTNGRSCTSCHIPENGWTISAATVQQMFDETDGLHPIFNVRDADRRQASDVSTVELRRQNFSMMLQGKFVRHINAPSSADYTITGADDPFGLGTTDRLFFFRSNSPSANFKANVVMWDANNTRDTLHAGLVKQATGNITGAQEGAAPTQETLDEIAEFQAALSHAQLIIPGVGRLDSDGARGGPEHHASQPLEVGRFDIYDAWADHDNPERARIARGQEIFNTPNAASGRTCFGCHNAANDGGNVQGRVFDIRTSDPAVHLNPDMAVYTFQDNVTGEIKHSTDPGRGLRTGQFADLNRFKTPSLRGIAARGEYFHNGSAGSLEEVVRHYEDQLGFDYTDEEREDLVAFLGAL